MPSDYIGQVGDNIRVRLRLFFRMDCSTDDYEKWLHKLADEWGNIVTWWGSRRLAYAGTVEKPGADVELNETIDAEFHVKGHTTYKGNRETIVVRLREWMEPEARAALKIHRKNEKDAQLRNAGVCPTCKGRQTHRGKPCPECKGGW